MSTVSPIITLTTLWAAIYSSTSLESQLFYTKNDFISNSCIGKENGNYWLKFDDSQDDYKPVYLQCNDEYVILDINQDDNLKDYFTTFVMWHYATGGPLNSNPVTWEEWFLPGHSNMNAKSSYLVSPDCNSCEETSKLQLNDDKSTYWLTGNLAKLYWRLFALPECDMDYTTYECYDCGVCEDVSKACHTTSLNDAESSGEFDTAGICSTAIRSSDTAVAETRNAAYGPDLAFKPSIGTDGRFCVCYKPDVLDYNEFELNKNDLEVMNSYVEANMIMKKEIVLEDEEKEDSGNDAVNTYYLGQKDFNKGPYRISEPGIYEITENVIFDFGNDKDYSYWPDITDSEEYPGAGEYRGAWHMGYFAGITVECDDVTINLNGFELKQSIEFYYQQRWFAVIELSSSQFLPGQGPAFFGSDPSFINNFELKNGILGLSSHFGIHGNFATNVKIENVHIREFVTHGIQLNGWENLYMNNIEIGPSSIYEYLLGDYGHARLMIPRLKGILVDLEDANAQAMEIQFAGRDAVTMEDIIDSLQYSMDLAYDYAINKYNKKHRDNDYIDPSLLSNAHESEVWLAAKKQFIWESGLPSATSIHGIFLNTHSVSVATFTLSTSNPSKNGKLSNIKIHDLKHGFHENVRLAYYGSNSGGIPGSEVAPWNSMIDARGSFGGDDILYEYYNVLQANTVGSVNAYDDSYKSFDYVGNVLTDSYVAMKHFSEDWNYLGFLLLSDTYTNWALGKSDETPVFDFGCNHDVMIHSGKGLLGLRMDGVENIELDNIEIYNLYEETKLGATFCGEYNDGERTSSMNVGAGGQFRQNLPIQSGFSGNNLQGISIVGSQNVNIINDMFIYNLNTHYGEGYGLSIWPNSRVNILNDVNIIISDLNMGSKLTDEYVDDNKLTYDSRPNRLPESCGIRLENKVGEEITGEFISSSIEYEENTIASTSGINLVVCNVQGYETCLGNSDYGYTMYGIYYETSDVCNDMIKSAGARDDHSLSTTLLGNGTGYIGFGLKFNSIMPLFALAFAVAVLLAMFMFAKYQPRKMVDTSYHNYGAIA